MSAFQDHRELEQRQRLVIGQRAEVASGALGVAIRHLGPRRIALDVTGLRGEHGSFSRFGPACEQMTEIQQRVTDRPGVPVENGRKACRRIRCDHHVERTVVAVDDRGWAHRWRVVCQPLTQKIQLRQVARAISVQLCQPAWNLAFEESLGLAQPVEPTAAPVDHRQIRAAVDVRHPQVVTQRRLRGERRRQLEAGGEAVDQFHDQERRTQHVGVFAQQ